MADLQDELVALRAQMAALSARLYRVEQRLGLNSETPSASPDAERQARLPRVSPFPSPPEARTEEPVPISPPALSFSVVHEEPREELEGQIGKLWLNRIGIIAILTGVSYFIKYAFDNGWIGPAGRIALGLLAGIGLIFWSDGLRARGHAPFSYAL